MEIEAYIQECKAKIKQARPTASTQIIDWNAPFLLTPEHPTQKGILLIHGLLDSCFAMRDLGKHFQEKGYLVFAILLPGHGTEPADLCKPTLEDWLKIIDQAIKALSQRVDTVSLGGHSTGAALALQYAADTPNANIQKIYAIAPACGLNNKWACLTGVFSKLGNYIPSLRFLKKQEENDCVKYQSMALNGAWQVYRLTKKLNTVTLNMPLYFALTAQDETVSFNAALTFFKRQTHPNNQCLVFSNQRIKTNKQIHCINSAILEKHILSLSHLGILYAPDNPHYGEQGDYTKLNKKRYKPTHYGSVHNVEKQKNGELVMRLFYNPFFEQLIACPQEEE